MGFCKYKKEDIHGLQRGQWRRHPRLAVEDYPMACVDDSIDTRKTKGRGRGRIAKCLEHIERYFRADRPCCSWQKSRARHASGALGSETKSGWWATSQMVQEMTCGRMCGERFTMRRTDHPVLPHSCSKANACRTRI